MRQQTGPELDSATTVAAFGAPDVQFAAVPEGAPISGAQLVPAIAELLELIQRCLTLPPAVPGALASTLLDSLPAATFGSVLPDLAAAPEPGFQILPLGAGISPPLSLDDQDLFGGAGEVSPIGGNSTGMPTLFRGFQLDLVGQETPFLPGLEIVDGPLPSPLAPVDFAPGKVTMFEGASKLELSSELAAALVDEGGQLVIDGDGDDVVILTAGWKIVDADPDANGYIYYVDSGSGQAVGIRSADVLLV